jgi:hypothetical protein
MADNVRRRANVDTFVVRHDGTLLGKIELTGDGPAGERYVARLRNLEGGVVGRLYSGDDRFAACAAIEDAIGNICEGAAMWRQRRMSALH